MRFALLLSALAGLTISVSTTSCPNPSAIKDGGFESGTRPGIGWTVSNVIGQSNYDLTSPGSTNNGGKYAFTAFLYGSPYTKGASGLTLSQTMQTCPGQNYSIVADYRFKYAASNNCAISIRYPYKTTTGSVTTGSGLGTEGAWYTTGSTFQAVSSADLFSIVFSCANWASNEISVDNVKILPFAGNAF